MMMMQSFMSSDVGWLIRHKPWPVPKHGSVLLYVHRKDGKPRTATSTFTQLLNSEKLSIDIQYLFAGLSPQTSVSSLHVTVEFVHFCGLL